MSTNKKEKSKKISMTRKRLLAFLTATAVFASYGASLGATGIFAETPEPLTSSASTEEFKTFSYNADAAETPTAYAALCTFTTTGGVVTLTLLAPGDSATFEYFIGAGAPDSESTWKEYTSLTTVTPTSPSDSGLTAESKVYVRAAAVTTVGSEADASEAVEIPYTAPAAEPPATTGSTYVKTDGETPSYTLTLKAPGESVNYEYLISSDVSTAADADSVDSGWVTYTGTTDTEVTAGLGDDKNVFIRIKAVGSGVASKSAKITMTTAEADADEVVVDEAKVTIGLKVNDDATAGTLTLTPVGADTTAYQYKIGEDGTWTDYSAAKEDIALGAAVSIRVKGNEAGKTYTAKSLSWTLLDQAAPTASNATYTDAADVRTLTVTGTFGDYEWSTNSGSSWTACDAATKEFTTSDTIQVRFKAVTNTKNASPAYTVQAAGSADPGTPSTPGTGTDIGGGTVSTSGSDVTWTVAATKESGKGTILTNADNVYSIIYGGLQDKFSDYIVFDGTGVPELEWSKTGKGAWQSIPKTDFYGTGAMVQAINTSTLLKKDKGTAEVPVYVYIRIAGDDIFAPSAPAAFDDTLAIKLTDSRDAAPKVLASLPLKAGTTKTDAETLLLGATGATKDIDTTKFADVMYNPYTDTIYLLKPKTGGTVAAAAKGAVIPAYTGVTQFIYTFKDATGEVFESFPVAPDAAEDALVPGYAQVSFSSGLFDNSFEQAAALKVSRLVYNGTTSVAAPYSQEGKFNYPVKAKAPKITYKNSTDTFTGSTAKMEYAIYRYNSATTATDTVDAASATWVSGSTGIIWQDVPKNAAGLADLITEMNVSKVAFRIKATNAKRESLATVVSVKTNLSDAPTVIYLPEKELFLISKASTAGVFGYDKGAIEYRINKFKAVPNAAGTDAVVADNWAKWLAIPKQTALKECDATGNTAATVKDYYSFPATTYIPAATAAPKVKIGGTLKPAANFNGWEVQFRFKGVDGTDASAKQASATKNFAIYKRGTVDSANLDYDAYNNKIIYSAKYLATAGNTDATSGQIKVPYTVDTVKTGMTVMDYTTATAATYGVDVKAASSVYVRKAAVGSVIEGFFSDTATTADTDKWSNSAQVILKTSSPAAAPAVKVDLTAVTDVITGLTASTEYDYEYYLSESATVNATAWNTAMADINKGDKGTYAATATAEDLATVFGTLSSLTGYPAVAPTAPLYLHVKFNVKGAKADTAATHDGDWSGNAAKTLSKVTAPTKQTAELVIIINPEVVRLTSASTAVTGASFGKDGDKTTYKLVLPSAPTGAKYQYVVSTSATAPATGWLAWPAAGVTKTNIPSTSHVFVRVQGVSGINTQTPVEIGDSTPVAADAPSIGSSTYVKTAGTAGADDTYKLTLAAPASGTYQYLLSSAAADATAADAVASGWVDYTAATEVTEGLGDTIKVFIRIKAVGTGVASKSAPIAMTTGSALTPAATPTEYAATATFKTVTGTVTLTLPAPASGTYEYFVGSAEPGDGATWTPYTAQVVLTPTELATLSASSKVYVRVQATSSNAASAAVEVAYDDGTGGDSTTTVAVDPTKVTIKLEVIAEGTSGTLTLTNLNSDTTEYQFTTDGSTWGNYTTGSPETGITLGASVSIRVKGSAADTTYTAYPVTWTLLTQTKPDNTAATYTVADNDLVGDESDDTLTLVIAANAAKYEFGQAATASEIVSWTSGDGTLTGLTKGTPIWIRLKAITNVADASEAYEVQVAP